MSLDRRNRYYLFAVFGQPDSEKLIQLLHREHISPVYIWKEKERDAERTYARLVGRQESTRNPLIWPALLEKSPTSSAWRVINNRPAGDKFLLIGRAYCPYSEAARESLKNADTEIYWATNAKDAQKFKTLYSQLTGGKRQLMTWPRIFRKANGTSSWQEIGGNSELQAMLNRNTKSDH